MAVYRRYKIPVGALIAAWLTVDILVEVRGRAFGAIITAARRRGYRGRERV